MNEKLEDCDESASSICNNRREFLVKATAMAGGVVLSLSGMKSAVAQTNAASTEKNSAAPLDEIVVKLDDKSPLGKVGGFTTIETKAGKVVVVRTTETAYSAYSAICPHKGGPIEYDEKTQQLFCPWHNSRFDTAGKVVRGPAKTSLKSFAAQKALVIGLDANS